MEKAGEDWYRQGWPSHNRTNRSIAVYDSYDQPKRLLTGTTYRWQCDCNRYTRPHISIRCCRGGSGYSFYNRCAAGHLGRAPKYLLGFSVAGGCLWMSACCVTRRKQQRPGIAADDNTTHVPTARSSADPTKPNHTRETPA